MHRPDADPSPAEAPELEGMVSLAMHGAKHWPRWHSPRQAANSFSSCTAASSIFVPVPRGITEV